MGAKNPVKITDTTFRDGHQSILATRMRTTDMLTLIKKMDATKMYSMEVWGGATFDVCTRYLGEDPWERLAAIREAAPNTRLQMLLRGQNLVGYRNYADDVVEAFVRRSAETGIDIFRVFDALNDPRNFETAFDAIKAAGKHIQAAMSYSLTGRRLGGNIYNIEYYVEKAKTFANMGADSICVKDMAGILSPMDCFDLVTALKSELDLPIHLHTHYTSGMASMTYLKGIEAGVDVVDCALAPFAMRTGQPAIEPLIASLYGTDRETRLDLDELICISQELGKVAPKYRDFLDDTKMSLVDTGVLKHQVPGGMLSNLVSQLRQANALDRLQEVYEEVPRVRKDLGMCPLVTPTSQIVGIQAVQNVLFGRYEMISAAVKDYAFGLYGAPPRRMDPVVRRKALADYPRGQKPVTGRPGSYLEPELEEARKDIGELAKTENDLITFALYPTTGRTFLKWKYGEEEMPFEVAEGKSTKQLAREDKVLSMVKAGSLDVDLKADLNVSHTFRISIGEDVYDLEVAQVGDTPFYNAPMGIPGAAVPGMIAAPPAAAEPAPEEILGTTLRAPMPGVVIRYLVKEGDKIAKGQKIMVLETMKMENALMAPCDGVVLKLHHVAGGNVEKDEALITVGEDK